MDPVRVAIRSHLAADATLKGLLSAGDAIYHAFAPETSEYPYAIFNRMSGTPVWAMTSTPALRSELWLVKGVTRGNQADAAEAIDSRCDELLNDAPLEITGRTLLYIRRESDMPAYNEVDSGEAIFHVGGLYRVSYE